jgi:sphingosine kinase
MREQGKARSIFSKTVLPILNAAGCTSDVTCQCHRCWGVLSRLRLLTNLNILVTTHNGHAYEIAKNLPLDYDAVVTLSGDGIIHEVLNGFAHHQESAKAFAIPIMPIPTGSGNGLSLNLLGIEVRTLCFRNSWNNEIIFPPGWF